MASGVIASFFVRHAVSKKKVYFGHVLKAIFDIRIAHLTAMLLIVGPEGPLHVVTYMIRDGMSL
jgi:hypothetical protein